MIWKRSTKCNPFPIWRGFCHSFINNNHSIIGHRRYLGGGYLFSSVTVLCAVCFELTSLNPEREFFWSCTFRRCFSAESTASTKNKRLLSCPLSSQFMKPTWVSKVALSELCVVSKAGVYVALKMMCLKSKQYQ